MLDLGLFREGLLMQGGQEAYVCVDPSFCKSCEKSFLDSFSKKKKKIVCSFAAVCQFKFEKD
jgi:hypothetical protein